MSLSVITEVAAIRENVRQLLTYIGYPYLVLRFGAVDPGALVSSRFAQPA